MSAGVDAPRSGDRASFVLIADARAGEAYHVGDLAMLVANVERLRAARPDARIAVVCPAPADELGLSDVEALAPPEVPAAFDALMASRPDLRDNAGHRMSDDHDAEHLIGDHDSDTPLASEHAA